MIKQPHHCCPGAQALLPGCPVLKSCTQAVEHHTQLTSGPLEGWLALAPALDPLLVSCPWIQLFCRKTRVHEGQTTERQFHVHIVGLPTVRSSARTRWLCHQLKRELEALQTLRVQQWNPAGANILNWRPLQQVPGAHILDKTDAASVHMTLQPLRQFTTLPEVHSST